MANFTCIKNANKNPAIDVDTEFIFSDGTTTVTLVPDNVLKDLAYTIKENFRYGNVIKNLTKDNQAKIIVLLATWTIDDICKILDCLPKKANGKVRSTAIPILITGIKILEGAGEPYAHLNSIDLAVMPTYGPDPDSTATFAKKKIPNQFHIGINSERANNIDANPIIADDGKLHVLSAEKPKAITTLVPGTIYKDIKGREFLYIGSGKIDTGVLHYIKYYETKLSKCTYHEKDYEDNIYIQVTKGIKDKLEKATSFKEFIVDYIDTKSKKILEHSMGVNTDELFYTSKSIKFIEEVETKFEAKDIPNTYNIKVDIVEIPKPGDTKDIELTVNIK